MQIAFRTSYYILFIGLFLFIYGLTTFNLGPFTSGLIFMWMGAGIMGHMLESQRIQGDAPGNHVS